MDKEYEVEAESAFSATVREVAIEPADDYAAQIEGALPTESQDVILDPYGNVDSLERRKVIRATIVDNIDRSDRRVNITLAAQRRRRTEEWRDAAEYTLARLRGGEEARIYLDAAETWELFETLRDLYRISRSGEPSGERNVYVVRRGAEGGPNVPLQDILDLLSAGGEAIWEQIAETRPNIPLALALHKLHAVRAAAVEDFEQHMTAGDWTENHWQNFFSRNSWIFGHGLAYHILDTVQEQPHYGGLSVTGRGDQRGDFLAATRANIKFTVLVEIKRADTNLVKREPYRRNVYGPSDELTGGVAQLLANCRTWVVEGARQDDNRDTLEGEDIYTYEPKGILVIGNTEEIAGDRYKCASFESFRRTLKNPEVLTFDEVLERAKFLVNYEEQTTELPSVADGLP